MTSHKGPPAHLVGPYHSAPPYGSASSFFQFPTQSYQGASPTDTLEPAPKRQRVGDAGQKTQTKVQGTNLPPAYTANTPASFDYDGGPAPQDSNHPPSKQPSLLPNRPHGGFKSRMKQQGTLLAIERAATRHTVQTKAYVAEPPASAPRYQKSEPADFFPWTGQHPEDVLNELTTRNGFYDKLPAAQNESLTARPSILSSLKNKSGLQILSSVFASALDQRQIHGKITVASTFKPPPRVTLTDTKREAWLRDLADPAVPLRRLSRTIPHGIRGKLLLDHCLSKDIPTSRALWLVKCVGANEIRACKRKGTGGVFAVGGEVKWIQDWTSAVEQFLETLLDKCGSENWKIRLNYGLRLTSHIYAEGLLDYDQYLRWLVNHVATCDLDNLPLWLLVMNIHKQDLLRCRQHGKHLTEALLAQLKSAEEPTNRVIYDFVLQELVDECRAILGSHPECFLLTQSWEMYKDIIQEHVVRDDGLLLLRFRHLQLRNRSLEDCAAGQGTKAKFSPEQTIVAALDGLARVQDYPKVASACLKASSNPDVLVDTCIQWASSTYRCGQFRVYAAARLLRIWSSYSVDLQTCVFRFLACSQDIPDIDPPEVYRLCAELVSSKHLSVGRYLQWLMASGALQRVREESSGTPCDVHFLSELPLRGLPKHVLNLRQSLLSSLGITVELEDSMINARKSQIVGQLPSLFPSTVVSDQYNEDATLCSLSRTSKYELACWIRTSIAPHPQEGVNKMQQTARERASQVTREDFCKLCHIFEDLEEYGILAEILFVLVKVTSDEALLAAITDMVNFHFDILNALGVVKDLFKALFSQRKLSPGPDGAGASFTHGLADLATSLPNTGPELRKLRKDAISLDPKQSAAAPSPISDNMVEAVQSDNSTFFEEMDQILTNGTSMDQPTLTRCFKAVIGHLEMSWDEAVAFPCRYPDLLARLRAFDPKSFDNLAALWLDSLVIQQGRPRLSAILVPMICHGVCTLGVVMDRALKHSQDPKSGQSALITLELLDLLSSVQSRYMPFVQYRSYRFLRQQQSIVEEHAESLVPLIHRCISEARTIGGHLQSQAKELLSGDNLKSLMSMVVCQISIEDKPIPMKDLEFRATLKDILPQEELLISATLDLRQMASRLLESVSYFNRPLSQLGFRNIIDSVLDPELNPLDIFTDVLMEKLETAPQAKVTLWSKLVSSLPASSALSIHERAENAILLEINNDETVFSDNFKATPDRLMEIVVATSLGIPDAAALVLLEQILERLHKLLGSLSLETHREDPKPDPNTLAHIVDILLRLLTIHQATILNSKFSQTTLSRICLSLASLHIHLSVSSELSSLANHITDVLSLLSDALSPDTRSRCIAALSSPSSQSQTLLHYPQLSFIFEDANTLSSSGKAWLHLVSKTGSASSTAAAAKEQQQQQPYSLRRWEMVQDATPVITENDTSLSLTLFGATRAVL